MSPQKGSLLGLMTQCEEEVMGEGGAVEEYGR
jgi:hypothetical protein